MMQNDNKVPLVVRTVDDIADGRNNAKRVWKKSPKENLRTCDG
jgi:hypothetical protein